MENNIISKLVLKIYIKKKELEIQQEYYDCLYQIILINKLKLEQFYKDKIDIFNIDFMYIFNNEFKNIYIDNGDNYYKELKHQEYLLHEEKRKLEIQKEYYNCLIRIK